jgi:hypothetical protein
LLAKGLQPTGRYGIGFFSVFMLGSNVTVTSRRFDSAASDAHTLDFQGGLKMRPILREPSADEALKRPGTRICVQLDIKADEPKGLIFSSQSGGVKKLRSLHELVTNLCPSLEVKIEVCDQTGKKEDVVAANDWQTLPKSELLQRTALIGWHNKLPIDKIKIALLIDTEGRIYGRAGICPFQDSFNTYGMVTVGGFRSCPIHGIAGILVGGPQTVSRDLALPTLPREVLLQWAEEQVTFFSELCDAGFLSWLLCYVNILIIFVIIRACLNLFLFF